MHSSQCFQVQEKAGKQVFKDNAGGFDIFSDEMGAFVSTDRTYYSNFVPCRVDQWEID